MMVPKMEEQVIEIKVRIDCNGCVQKIKKALHHINGKQFRNSNTIKICIHHIDFDFSHQKIAIVGSAHPEEIVKAIKKTRKYVIICSQTEQSNQPAHQPPENPPPESKPSSLESADDTTNQSTTQPSKPKDREEIHGDRYNAYGSNDQEINGGRWRVYGGGPGEPSQPIRPLYVTESYSTYKPSPYVTEYVYAHSLPRYSSNITPNYYSQDYYDGNVTSIFSEDNPNACRIV